MSNTTSIHNGTPDIHDSGEEKTGPIAIHIKLERAIAAEACSPQRSQRKKGEADNGLDAFLMAILSMQL